MAPSKAAESSTGLPDGYRAIPVHAIGAEVPLRVCVLVRQTPDPVAGHFVLLRDLHDALVYVGDKRLAKALIPWLHKTDPVSRMGSDRSPAMVRQCDYALWTAHLLSIGVTLPANRIDNYSPAILAAHLAQRVLH